MIIEYIGKQDHAFSDYVLDGATLTVAGIAVDLAAEQQDQELRIVFVRHEGKIRRGMIPCCEYAVEVVIPPRRYETVEIPASEESEILEEGTEQIAEEAYMGSIALPLDTETVMLRLWSLREGVCHDN
jgi:hypothetical protein